MMNKNIMNIIVSKMALNRWKKIVKNVNKEYHKYFKYLKYKHVDVIVPAQYISCLDGIMLYNYRKYGNESKIVNHNFEKCEECSIKIHPKNDYIEIDLPKNYW